MAEWGCGKVGEKSENVRLMEGIEQLNNTPGSRVIEQINRLDVSFYTFNLNHNDMMEAIELLERDDVGKAMLKVAAAHDNYTKLRPALKEIVRRLHNFVAAAKTLVEHTRIIAREMFKGHEFMGEYEKAIADTFTNNGLIQFVQGLRNYILHRDLPMSVIQFTFDVETGKVQNRVMMDLDSLRSWDGWKPAATEYMAATGKDASLGEIISLYTSTVVGFHNWFSEKQRKLHADELAETEKLRLELLENAKQLGLR